MTDRIEEIKQLVTDALEDMKAKDITCLHVAPITSIADYMIIASGTSKRHLQSVAEHVYTSVKKAGVLPSLEGEPGSDWVLVDMGDLIVHIMTAETRQFYDLEKLWTLTPDDADSSEATTH